MNNKYSDGSSSAYAELPVPAAYLSWTRGNASLSPVAEVDPGAYFGGWRAFVKSQKDSLLLPELPISKITRVSQDGRHKYEVYATNVLNFLPVQHRMRYELREDATDPETGREYKKVVATSKRKQPGYQPYRQIFGLVFAPDGEQFAPGVIKAYNWSAFISLEKAGQAWNKIAIPAGQALIRRYGSIGTKEGMPKFETFGKAQSTPIDAVGLDKPRFFSITPELDELWDASLAWKECERWNATGEVQEEPTTNGMREFMEECERLYLSEAEIEQILAENNNSYAKALAALQGNDLETMNAMAEEVDEIF